ncbi:MAG TPA: ABC transporter substrate-binding protein, partial [Rhizobiaceae bacterium]|nr:ABC transporter substrate-binding protein [Rhizobiaceae bacterium]
YAAAGWSDLENRLSSNAELKAWADKFKAATGEDAGTAAQLGASAAMALIKGLEAAGKDLTPESFQKGMETLAYHDPIADGDVKYGPNDHQGGDVIVISKIEGGVWKEIGRVDPTKSQ